MKAVLYLPYYDYNDGAFDVSDTYYDDNEYAKRMSEEYNRSKDVVYNSMNDFKNGSQNVFNGIDGQTYKFGQKVSQSEEKVAYSSCDGIIYNGEGKDESVDELITHFAKQESFVCMFELDMDSSEEEFETEISLWSNEHNKINAYGDKMSDEWVWVNEPKRNVKIKFTNNANETIYAILEDCKIMNKIDFSTFIIYVGKVRLIDEI